MVLGPTEQTFSQTSADDSSLRSRWRHLATVAVVLSYVGYLADA